MSVTVSTTACGESFPSDAAPSYALTATENPPDMCVFGWGHPGWDYGTTNDCCADPRDSSFGLCNTGPTTNALNCPGGLHAATACNNINGYSNYNCSPLTCVPSAACKTGNICFGTITDTSTGSPNQGLFCYFEFNKQTSKSNPATIFNFCCANGVSPNSNNVCPLPGDMGPTGPTGVTGATGDIGATGFTGQYIWITHHHLTYAVFPLFLLLLLFLLLCNRCYG